ncbi:MAG: hypothetical protein NT060_02175 [Candidatus Omnitrophica bacterium]|nr:hypothetical protein [Candidatus Omnitrophota bacterium]
MKNYKMVLIAAAFIAGLFLCVFLSAAFSQDESQSSSVVATEPQVVADKGVVDAGTEEVDSETQNNAYKTDIEQDESKDGQVSANEEKPQEESKYLYERRGRLPPIPRNN